MRKSPSHEASAQSDQDLVGRARAGSGAAFATLVLRHRHEIYRLALRRLGNRSDAEDVVQETFLRAWRAIASFDGRAQIRSWLYRIAINVAGTHWRASSRRPTESLQALSPRFEDSGWSETTDSVRTCRADEVVEQKELARLVREAFRLLEDSYRAVFVRCALEGGSTEEVANDLGISSANVRQRLSRARRKLRRQLTGDANVTARRPSSCRRAFRD